jgi:hypothetical protein
MPGAIDPYSDAPALVHCAVPATPGDFARLEYEFEKAQIQDSHRVSFRTEGRYSPGA